MTGFDIWQSLRRVPCLACADSLHPRFLESGRHQLPAHNNAVSASGKVSHPLMRQDRLLGQNVPEVLSGI